MISKTPEPGLPALTRWQWLRSAHLPWPALCPICNSWTSTPLCRDCVARFHVPAHRCHRCACRLTPGMAVCGRCLQQPPLFERAVAAFDYAFPWDKLIADFKFRQRVELGRALAQRLCASLEAQAGPPPWQGVELVTAVPLSTERLRERGYNHSWEVARRVARTLHLPARHDTLLRWRDTAHQITLDRAARAANLRGAFMPAPAARDFIAGRHVALVDDVLTTGATAAEATRALLEAGAGRVDLWLLARTEPHA